MVTVKTVKSQSDKKSDEGRVKLYKSQKDFQVG